MLVKTILITILIFFSNFSSATLNIQHWESNNGARIYFVENHDLPIVDINVDLELEVLRTPNKKVE